MQQIKFRGQRIDNNIWIYGYYHEVESEGNTYAYIFWQGHSEPVIKETAGQFTGLTDNNGVEVYEGAKLQLTITSFNSIVKQDCIIEFNKGAFKIKHKGGMYSYIDSLASNVSLEVTGNIHESKI